MPKTATATAARKRATKKVAAPAPEQDELPAPPVTDSEAWFAPLDEVAEFVNILAYGREGSTKTTSLARMSTLGKVLIINAEGGVKKAPLIRRGAVAENLMIWPVPGSKTRITHKSLDALYRRVKADLLEDPNSWFCIGFDSITEVYQAVLDDVSGGRVKKLKDKGAEPDEFFVDISDYGTMSKMIRDLLRKFRDLPCHVVFTALERRDIDKDTGKPQYGPAITPGLQTDLLGYPDFVLMFKAADEDGPARALTRSNSRYRAKDRFDILPRVLAEPMGDRIIQYVTGDLTEDTDPFQNDLPVKATKAQDRPDSANDDEDDSEDDQSDE